MLRGCRFAGILGSTRCWGRTGQGSGLVVYLATACFLSYLMSGHSGIYLSQRVGTPKIGGAGAEEGESLRAVRARRG
jgi:hypothetical protein